MKNIDIKEKQNDNLNMRSQSEYSGDSGESHLNKPITTKFLIKFTIPTIISFIIMNIFGTIDGVFASRGIGEHALGAINFVMPFFTFTLAIGTMLSMGGCALITKKKGKKLFEESRENFTLLTIVTFAASMTLAIISWFLRRPLLRVLGTDSAVFDYALEYIQPLIIMMPFIMVGLFLVQFLIAEGRPVIGMIASSSGAMISTILNAIFLFRFDMGIEGLAIATGIGYAVPAVLGVIYFSLMRKGSIYFVRPKWDAKALGRSSLNGVSEMVTMMAATATTVVMNNVLVRMDGVGWQGVAAAGIVLALQGIFSSLFLGYSAGVAPVISYNYGKKKHDGKEGEVEKENYDNLNKLYKSSLAIIGILSVIALVGAMVFANLLVSIYVDPEYCSYTGINLHSMAVRGLRIAAIGYIFMGFNVFATAWFTALNDGLISGIISIIRTFVLTLSLLIGLSHVFGLTGAWIALPGAEILAITLTIYFLIKLGSKYNYR